MYESKVPALTKPIFNTELSVRITDINYGNHLGNDSLVALLHEARVQFLHKYNFTELNVGGVGLVVTNLVVNYLAESFYSDSLIIELEIGEKSKTSVDLIYKVQLKDGKEIARAITTITFFDYNRKRVCRIPQEFISIIEGENKSS